MYSNLQAFIPNHFNNTPSFHPFPRRYRHTRPVTVITVFCPNIQFDERELWNGPFIKQDAIYRVLIFSCAMMWGWIYLKKRWCVRLVLCHFLVISHANLLRASPGFALTVNLQNSVDSKQPMNRSTGFFPYQKQTASYHINYKLRYDGTLFCVHCINSTEPAFSVFLSPVLIYVVLYRTNSCIKYSIYDCIIV